MAPAQENQSRSLLAQLDTQPRVRDYLTRAVEAQRTSHAYLFLGAPGSGKLDAAWALAQALICEHGGCGACEACVRVARRTHPDVRYLAPESATGYLIAQIRDLLEEVPLAPVRAERKVYILDRADQLRASSANALLKTLEEPLANVTFILLGTSADTILPTIVSRCQCVPFRLISPDAATQAVARATGLPPERCRMAVAVAGSPARAREFLKSASRQEARRAMLRAIDALPHADEADALASAKTVTLAVKAPLAEVKSTQDAILKRDEEYLSRGALKQIEDRNKRELTARERSGIMEVLACARSLVRDALMRLEGIPDSPVNADAADIVERLASAMDSPVCAVHALEAIASAERAVRRNVTPQLAFEVMLLDIRKAFTCP